MAHEHKRAAVGSAGAQQQVHEAVAQGRVQRRSRLVRDHEFRRAQQRARRRHPLLLAHRQRVGTPPPQVCLQAHALQQRLRRSRGRPRTARRPQAREAAGQQHIFEHRQVRQQVELLEDHADVVGSPCVTRTGWQHCPRLAQQRHAALLRLQHTGHQPEQRALATAAGAVQEKCAAGGQVERVNGDAVGRAGPGKTQVADLQHAE